MQVVFPILAIVTSLSNCLALQQFLYSILICLMIIYFMILHLSEILYLNCRLRVFSALNLLVYLPRCLDYYSVHTGDRMFVDNSLEREMHPLQAHEAKVAHFYYFSPVSFSIALHRVKNPGLWSQATGFNSCSTLVKLLASAFLSFLTYF